MNRTLELIFENQLQKPIKLQIPQIKQNITKDLVKTTMDSLIALNILKFSSGTPVKVKSAQLIDKTITILF